MIDPVIFPLAAATRAYQAESLMILGLEVISLVLLTHLVLLPLTGVVRTLDRIDKS